MPAFSYLINEGMSDNEICPFGIFSCGRIRFSCDHNM